MRNIRAHQPSHNNGKPCNSFDTVGSQRPATEDAGLPYYMRDEEIAADGQSCIHHECAVVDCNMATEVNAEVNAAKENNEWVAVLLWRTLRKLSQWRFA